MSKKQFAARAAAVIASFLLLWFSAGMIDYMRTVILYREPIFCLKNADETGGFYHGLGYTYVIVGNFGEETPENPYGARYIEFELFGKRIETLNRY